MALDPKKWTQKTQEAVAAAQEDARANSNPELTPDHVLAALLRQEGSVVLPVVQKLGKAPLMLRNKADEAVAKLPKAYGGETRLGREFTRPGPWHIPKNVTPTLVNVIVSSGTTDKADLTRVRVSRIAANKGIVEEVNVRKILDGGSLTSDLTLNEGDLVTIPAGPTSVVYVSGNVMHQGSFPLKSGERLSAYGAILQNGGFARFADQAGVYVLRALPIGTKVPLPVNIKDIKSGRRPDLILQSGDILVVPEKFWSIW